MTSAKIRAHLLDLARERLHAKAAGLDTNAAYMRDLEEEAAELQAAYVEAALTEIATLRGELFGRDQG